jgi:hypothetical protein
MGIVAEKRRLAVFTGRGGAIVLKFMSERKASTLSTAGLFGGDC